MVRADVGPFKLLLNANSFTQSACEHQAYKSEQYGVYCALFGKKWLGKDLAMLWKKVWSWQQKDFGYIKIGLMSMNRMRILVLFYRIIDTVVTRLCIVLVSRKSNNSDIKTLYSSRDSQNKNHYLKTQIMISVQKLRAEGLKIDIRLWQWKLLTTVTNSQGQQPVPHGFQSQVDILFLSPTE